MTRTTLCVPLGRYTIELRRLRRDCVEDPPDDPRPIFEDAAGVPFEDPERVVFSDGDRLGPLPLPVRCRYWAARRRSSVSAIGPIWTRQNRRGPTGMVEATLETVSGVQGVRCWEDYADKFDLIEELEPTYGIRRAKRAAKRCYRYFNSR